MSTPIVVNTTLTANALSANVLAGNVNEFLARPAVISVFCSASGSSPQMFLNVGGIQRVQAIPMPNTNRFPVRPDDGIVQFRAPAGARLFLQYLEVAGATPTVITLMDIDYIG